METSLYPRVEGIVGRREQIQGILLSEAILGGAGGKLPFLQPKKPLPLMVMSMPMLCYLCVYCGGHV